MLKLAARNITQLNAEVDVSVCHAILHQTSYFVSCR